MEGFSKAKQIPVSKLPKGLKDRVFRSADNNIQPVGKVPSEDTESAHTVHKVELVPGGIVAMLEKHTIALDQLKEILVLLEDRLASILRPGEKDRDLVKSNSDEGSAITELIKTHTLTVDTVIEALTALCARIDI